MTVERALICVVFVLNDVSQRVAGLGQCPGEDPVRVLRVRCDGWISPPLRRAVRAPCAVEANEPVLAPDLPIVLPIARLAAVTAVAHDPSKETFRARAVARRAVCDVLDRHQV